MAARFSNTGSAGCNGPAGPLALGCSGGVDRGLVELVDAGGMGVPDRAGHGTGAAGRRPAVLEHASVSTACAVLVQSSLRYNFHSHTLLAGELLRRSISRIFAF